MSSRQSALPIQAQFLDRFSPRAFSGKKLTPADIETMVEAARSHCQPRGQRITADDVKVAQLPAAARAA